MTTPSDAVGTLLDSVKPIVTMERDGLVVIALSANATGSALLRDDQVVHAEVHRVV